MGGRDGYPTLVWPGVLRSDERRDDPDFDTAGLSGRSAVWPGNSFGAHFATRRICSAAKMPESGARIGTHRIARNVTD